jgi:hypothetical protein
LLRGEDTDFLSNSDGSLLGITSNHDNRNTSSLAILNSFCDFFSWRILNCDETQESAVAFEFVIFVLVSSFS